MQATRLRRGGTLHLASFADIRNGLDPVVSPDGLSAGPMHLIFAGLVDYDAQGRLVPDLAERWEVADGGRTYRFFLRRGVTMHDGGTLVVIQGPRFSTKAESAWFRREGRSRVVP